MKTIKNLLFVIAGAILFGAFISFSPTKNILYDSLPITIIDFFVFLLWAFYSLKLTNVV